MRLMCKMFIICFIFSNSIFSQVFYFQLSNLKFPIYSYAWGSNTSATCTGKNFPLVDSISKLSFKMHRGSILVKEFSSMLGGWRFYYETYGIDSGYIAENNIPKLYFSQIFLNFNTTEFTSHLGSTTRSYSMSLFALIDTVRSNQTWLNALGRETKSFVIPVGYVHESSGGFDGNMEFNKSSVSFESATTLQTGVTDFSNLNGIYNSKNIKVQMDFSPPPVYYATPANTLNINVTNEYGRPSVTNSLLRNPSNLRVYPLQTILRSLHSSYKAKLKIDIGNILNMYNDEIEDVGAYYHDVVSVVNPGSSGVYYVGENRIRYIKPSTIVIDLVEQKGYQIFYFVKRILNSVNDNNNGILPTEFSLEQNYPNPFNPSTNINFMLPEKSLVKLEVFNSLGQIITSLVDEVLPAGNYDRKLTLNKESGIYFYRLIATPLNSNKKTFSEVKKLMFLK